MILAVFLMLSIIYLSGLNAQSNAEALNNDHIEIVDSLPYAKYIYNNKANNIKESTYNNKKLEETSKNKFNEEEKIEHILLVGIDSRRNDFKNARADTIIIASINKLNREIKLTSIMRDTYVRIPRHKNNRINTAYAFGGAELLKNTINKNFKLKIDKYIVIDFRGFQKVMDILGGIDVDIKKYEVNELNRCIVLLGGKRTDFIRQNGVNQLNGEQTLAYCRIRKVGNGDFERTERQRSILKLIIGKVKELSFSEYPKIIANMYPYVRTNISNGECLKLIYNYHDVKDWKVESIQIPTGQSGKFRIINSMSVIDPDIDECIKCIKEFIY